MMSAHDAVAEYSAAAEARDLDEDARITDFWPDPYALPANRAHLVKRC